MERPSEERPITEVPSGPAAETFEPECIAIVQRRIGDCTAMEQARKASKLTPRFREEMIGQAVHSFARIYDEEPTERITPGTCAMVFLATLMLGGGAVWSWLRIEGSSGRWISVACLLGIIAVWGGLWYWIVTHSPRKRVRTWLAMALAPLDPTVEEIRQARRELQARRMGAGFKIRSGKVLAKIEKIKKSGMMPG